MKASAEKGTRWAQGSIGPVLKKCRIRMLAICALDARRKDLDPETWDLLFICRSEADVWRAILDRLNNRPVLTVADFNGFAENGGMIEPLMVQEKVRWQINCSRAKAANLRISGRLQRNALRVINGGHAEKNAPAQNRRPPHADGHAGPHSPGEPRP